MKVYTICGAGDEKKIHALFVLAMVFTIANCQKMDSTVFC